MNYLLIDSPFIFFPCTVVALNYSLLQTALFLMLLFLPSFLPYWCCSESSFQECTEKLLSVFHAHETSLRQLG